MPHRFVLLHNGLVRLAVSIFARGVAALVEKELGLVKIFLIARGKIELGKRHLGYLVPRHERSLPFAVAYGTAHTVGIAYGDIEEIAFARGL